jgi:hypothetical protein
VDIELYSIPEIKANIRVEQRRKSIIGQKRKTPEIGVWKEQKKKNQSISSPASPCPSQYNFQHHFPLPQLPSQMVGGNQAHAYARLRGGT